jgi:putative membrane protein
MHPRLRAPRIVASIAGIALLWVALDWPIGTLGAGYLASVHMVQFFLIAMIAPALLVYGWPPARPTAESESVRTRAFRSLVDALTHPVVAVIIFDVVVVATHSPPVVDSLMASQVGSFLLDMAWLLAGAAIVLGAITVVFFRWQAEMERSEVGG